MLLLFLIGWEVGATAPNAILAIKIFFKELSRRDTARFTVEIVKAFRRPYLIKAALVFFIGIGMRISVKRPSL